MPRLRRIDADRVEHCDRLGAAEVAVVGAGHEEAGQHAVAACRERDAQRRVVERLVEPAAQVAVTVAAGYASIDRDDPVEIGCGHRAHVGAAAAGALEVVGIVPTEIDLGSDVGGVGPAHRVVALGAPGVGVDDALEHLRRRQRETAPVEPAEHAVIAPRRLRPHRADRVSARPRRERVEETAADALAAPVGADADELDAQLPLAAAELALEHARKQVADDAAVVDRRELRVQPRRAARGLQAALDVAAP